MITQDIFHKYNAMKSNRNLKPSLWPKGRKAGRQAQAGSATVSLPHGQQLEYPRKKLVVVLETGIPNPGT